MRAHFIRAQRALRIINLTHRAVGAHSGAHCNAWLHWGVCRRDPQRHLHAAIPLDRLRKEAGQASILWLADMRAELQDAILPRCYVRDATN